MKRLFLIMAAVLVVTMAVAAACSGSTPTATAKPGPTVTVTANPTPVSTVTVTAKPTPTPLKFSKIIDAEATGGTGGWFTQTGIDQGIYKKYGLDVGLTSMAAAAARVAPFLGQADWSQGGILQALDTVKQGIPMQIIGPTMVGHYSIVVPKDSPIKSVTDLKGKKVAHGGPATAVYRLALLTFKLYGIDMEKDFTLMNADAPVMSGWVENGQVDAAILWEPYQTKLIAAGKARELAFLSDLYKAKTGQPLLVGGVYAHAIWVKQNPEMAKALGQAHTEVFRYTYTHPEIWKSDSSLKLWKVEDPATAELLAQRMPRIADIPAWGPAYKEALMSQVRAAVDAGLYPKEAIDQADKDIIVVLQ